MLMVMEQQTTMRYETHWNPCRVVYYRDALNHHQLSKTDADDVWDVSKQHVHTRKSSPEGAQLAWISIFVVLLSVVDVSEFTFSTLGSTEGKGSQREEMRFLRD